MAADDGDEALLRAVGRGEPAAVRAMIARKLPRVSALAARMLGDPAEAEDVAQEAFMRLWRHASGFRWGRASLDTWLHRVVLNLCYDRLRRRREQPMAEPPEQADPTPGADQRLQAREASRRVQAALDDLPERQRAAILLHHYEDLSNGEAAGVLGVSVDALESLLARARRTLRTRLQELRT